MPSSPITEHEPVAFSELDGSEAISPGLVTRLPHTWLGEVVVAALPWRLDGVRPGPSSAGPAIGEHTHQLLSDILGLDAAALAAFEADGSLE